jgi:secreted trypsin-like serine protease
VVPRIGNLGTKEMRMQLRVLTVLAAVFAGGTCFGDSGGPIFVAGTRTITSVNSYAKNSTCSGTTGAYRIDQADDLAFIASFGVTA